jgi:hypothetical protein
VPAGGHKRVLTWIGTRHLPYNYEETPLPIVDNHMICAIRLDDKWVFLDGTDPLIPFGNNPEGIQGKEAMIAIGPKEYKIIKVPEAPADANVITDTTVMHITGNGVAGDLSIDYKGYPAWNLGNLMMYYKNDDRDNEMHNITERGSNKYLQTGYTYDQGETGDKQARITAAFTIDDYVQQVGKECYVNMNVQRRYEDTRADEKDRTVPLWCKYKDKQNEVVQLQIPAGYHVSYLPPNAQGKMEGNRSYKITYTATPTTITLTKEYEWLTLALPADKFAENNKMTDELKKQYKESVVLSAN